MEQGNNGLEETVGFIREHRSKEASFDILYKKLEQEIAAGSSPYVAQLQELKEKAAAEYETAKKVSGTAWPEFEKFASGFERIALQFLKRG